MIIHRTIIAALLFIFNLSSYSFTQVIYSNSFETPQDTIGLHGYGSIQFNSDAPPDGGNQSLYISGGCLWPHALFELGSFNSNGLYIIRCWGKNLQIGGDVSLNVEGNLPLNGINISVNEKNWTYYESAETLFCPAGKKLELSMNAGGIAASAMLVDKIEVVNVQATNSGWILRKIGTSENLNDVAMIDSSTAVIAGSGGSILKTTDAGETWRNTAPQLDCNPEIPGCLMKWNSVVFYDDLNGIAAGKSRLLITSDGGEDWQFLNAPSGNNFVSIGKIALFNIFVGDDSGYIYNSLDTGKTWTSEKVADSPVLSIYTAKYSPIIFGIYILEVYALTSNSLFIKRGAEKWHNWGSLGYFQGLGSGAFKGEFSENGTQFIVGVQGDFVPQSIIIRLRPPDSYWYSVGPPSEIGELHSLAVPTLNLIYPVGERVLPPPALVYTCGSGGKILKSTDNGNFWISQNTPTSQNLNSIYFFDKDKGFAVGDSGTILYTSTGGISAANNEPSSFSLISPPDEDVRPVPRSISFMWHKSVDPDGDPLEYSVLISEDSCASWRTYGPTTDTLLQIQSPAQVPGKYFWMVVANDGMNPRISREIFTLTIYSVSSAGENEGSTPEKFALHQNYPNPFNPATRIRYELPEGSDVRLIIYNALGEKTAELVNSFQKAGRYEVEWNGENYPSGIYIYQFKAGSFTLSKKFILLK
ncbi:MAG TPA: YCF48-related protein [Ignavibacteriaceae bacterium]|nr:YCF48-related protein [Ignavibacteriaceae bacterium]